MRLEEELKTQGLVLPEPVSTQDDSGQTVDWRRGDSRKDYFYWNSRGYFEYHKGGKVNPDGTPYGEAGTSHNEKVDGDKDEGKNDEEGEDDDTIFEHNEV